MTDNHMNRMTPAEWNRAVAAAEAYGQALETGDPDLIAQAHKHALDAGCTDSGQPPAGPARYDASSK